MNHENPWDIALPLITSNGEADKLNTTTIEILNRFSTKPTQTQGSQSLDLMSWREMRNVP